MKCIMCGSDDLFYQQVLVDPCGEQTGYLTCNECGTEWFDDTLTDIDVEALLNASEK